MTTRVSAAPQARVTSRSWACPTSAKICSGSEFIRPRGCTIVPEHMALVNSSGAVSPAARAIGEQRAGDQAREAAGQDDPQRDLPARRAERECRLAQRVGHEQQHDLRRAHDRPAASAGRGRRSPSSPRSPAEDRWPRGRCRRTGRRRSTARRSGRRRSSGRPPAKRLLRPYSTR